MSRQPLRGPVTDHDTPPVERARDEVALVRSKTLARVSALAVGGGVVGALAVLLGNTFVGDLAVPAIAVVAFVVAALLGGVALGGGPSERTEYW